MTAERNRFTDWSTLPLTLNAGDVSRILGISTPNAYALMNRKDFPSIRVSDRRIVVMKDALRRFLEHQAG